MEPIDPRTVRARPAPRLQWRKPPPLDGAVALVERGAESEQRRIQAERQRSVLPHIYFSLASLPPTPGEPDPEPQDTPSLTRPIPLEVGVIRKKEPECRLGSPSVTPPVPPKPLATFDQSGVGRLDHTPAHVQTPPGDLGHGSGSTTPLSATALMDQGRNFHITTVEVPDSSVTMTTNNLTPAEMASLTMLPWQPVMGEQWPESHVIMRKQNTLFTAAEVSALKEELRSTGRVNCPFESCPRKYMSVSSLNRHIREGQEHINARNSFSPNLCSSPISSGGSSCPSDGALATAGHRLVSDEVDDRAVKLGSCSPSTKCSVIRLKGCDNENRDDSSQGLENGFTPVQDRGQHVSQGLLQCPVQGCFSKYLSPRSLNRHLCSHNESNEGERDPNRFSEWLPGFTNGEVAIMRETLRTTGSIPCPVQGCPRLLKSTKGIRYHILRHSVPQRRRSKAAPRQEGERFLGFTSDEVAELRSKIRAGGSAECPIEGCHRLYKSLDGLNCHVLYKHSGLPGTRAPPTPLEEDLTVRINLSCLSPGGEPGSLGHTSAEDSDTMKLSNQARIDEPITERGSREGGAGTEIPKVAVKEERGEGWEVMVVGGKEGKRIEQDHQLALWGKKSTKLVEYLQGCR